MTVLSQLPSIITFTPLTLVCSNLELLLKHRVYTHDALLSYLVELSGVPDKILLIHYCTLFFKICPSFNRSFLYWLANKRGILEAQSKVFKGILQFPCRFNNLINYRKNLDISPESDLTFCKSEWGNIKNAYIMPTLWTRSTI